MDKEFKEKLLELLKKQNDEADHEKKLSISEEIADLAVKYDHYLPDEIDSLDIDDEDRLVMRIKILPIPRWADGEVLSFAPGVDQETGELVKTR